MGYKIVDSHNEMDTYLSDFLKRWPSIQIANEDDNEQLLNLVKNESMNSGGLSISYDQSPDFSKYSNKMGNSSLTFIWKHQDSIVGTATVIFDKKRINGHDNSTAYFSGLRISQQMPIRTRALWRKQYADLIRIIANSNSNYHANFLYTAVLDKNQRALNAFTKSKSFKYVEFEKYESYNILAKSNLFDIPRLFRSKPSFSVLPVEDLDFRQITEFLEKETQDTPFAPNISSRIAQIKSNFANSQSKIYKILYGEKIIGVFEASDTKETRRLILKKVSKPYKLFNLLLRAHRRPSFKENRPLSILNLNLFVLKKSLDFKNKKNALAEVISTLLKENKYKDYHVINFITPLGFDPSEHRILNRHMIKKGFIFHREKGTIYEVKTLDDSFGLSESPNESKKELKQSLIEVGYL